MYCHVSLADPVCPRLAGYAAAALDDLQQLAHAGAVEPAVAHDALGLLYRLARSA